MNTKKANITCSRIAHTLCDLSPNTTAIMDAVRIAENGKDGRYCIPEPYVKRITITVEVEIYDPLNSANFRGHPNRITRRASKTRTI